MRVFVLVEPKFFASPEVFPTLMDRFAAWRDANRERMEAFEFFAGAGGDSASWFLAHIHRSAWNINSANYFALTAF